MRADSAGKWDEPAGGGGRNSHGKRFARGQIGENNQDRCSLFTDMTVAYRPASVCAKATPNPVERAGEHVLIGNRQTGLGGTRFEAEN